MPTGSLPKDAAWRLRILRVRPPRRRRLNARHDCRRVDSPADLSPASPTPDRLGRSDGSGSRLDRAAQRRLDLRCRLRGLGHPSSSGTGAAISAGSFKGDFRPTVAISHDGAGLRDRGDGAGPRVSRGRRRADAPPDLERNSLDRRLDPRPALPPARPRLAPVHRRDFDSARHRPSPDRSRGRSSLRSKTLDIPGRRGSSAEPYRPPLSSCGVRTNSKHPHRNRRRSDGRRPRLAARRCNGRSRSRRPWRRSLDETRPAIPDRADCRLGLFHRSARSAKRGPRSTVCGRRVPHRLSSRRRREPRGVDRRPASAAAVFVGPPTRSRSGSGSHRLRRDLAGDHGGGPFRRLPHPGGRLRRKRHCRIPAIDARSSARESQTSTAGSRGRRSRAQGKVWPSLRRGISSPHRGASG